MTKLIFGCGYLGKRVAERWRAGGETVYAVTRSADRARVLAAAGLVPLVADVTRPQSLTGLPEARTVLFAVGHDRRSPHSIGEVYVAGLANVLAVLPAGVERFIYISSTGVYGDAAGESVDEQTPCQPRRAGGRAHLAAEQLLAAGAIGPKAIVLRMAGIYGPGRIPRAADLAAGRPIDAPAAGHLNLIHVDDAADIVLVAEGRARPPRTIVVADGQPVVRRDYYAELARLIGAAPPRFVAPDPNSPAAARAVSDRRIDNARLIAELGVQLRYPSYREGLRAILAGE